jgi:hypothetical protein
MREMVAWMVADRVETASEIRFVIAGTEIGTTIRIVG